MDSAALDETSATLRPSEEEAEEEMEYQNGKAGLEPVSEQHSASGLRLGPLPGSRCRTTPICTTALDLNIVSKSLTGSNLHCDVKLST